MLNESERAKKSGVVVLNDTSYAAGLMWEPADNPDRAMKEAYNVAKSEAVDADFLCLRLSTPPQYGLGWKSVGHFSGAKPLAAAVTENVGGNYVGAFSLGDKWWFGMSKNDIILPYGDALYSSEDEIKEVMANALAEVSNETLKFAPASWGIEGARDSELEVLITNVPRIKLTPTDSLFSRYRSGLLSIAVLLIALYMGFNYISDKIATEQAIRATRQRQIQEAMQNPFPWKNTPLARDFLNNCVKEVDIIPLGISGWNIESVVCSAKNIKAHLIKSGGFIYDIENKADKLGFALSLDANGSNAIISKLVEGVPNRYSYVKGEDLWAGSEISQQFLDLKAKIGVDVMLSGVSKIPARPRVVIDENGRSITLPPIYTPVKFSFTTTYPVESWIGYLSAFPGLSIDTLTLKVESVVSWSITGTVYQK